MFETTPTNESRRTKFRVRTSLIHLSALVVGIISEVLIERYFHKEGLGIPIALALDVIAWLMVFDYEYGEVFEAIKQNLPPDRRPHGLQQFDTLLGTVAELSEQIRTLQLKSDDLRYQIVPLELLSRPTDQWLFRNRFDQILKTSHENLKQLSNGYFSVPITTDISRSSMETCQQLKNSAFCVALEKHLGMWWETTNYAVLLQENFRAAKNISAQRQPYDNFKGHFIRVFVLDSLDSVTPQVHDLMHQMADNGIEVRVLLEEKVRNEVLIGDMSHLHYEDLDFGLWDEEYVMTITGNEHSRTMTVKSDHQTLHTIKTVRKKLMDASETFQAFDERVRRPLNSWSDFGDKLINLPAPNGPHLKDVENIFTLAERHFSSEGGKLTVLGLTEKLVQKARALKCERPGLSVEIVDQRSHHPAAVESGFDFIKRNWLEFDPTNESDVILGDDVLCNLSVSQLPIFFKSMADALKSNGSFIVRTTGIFELDPKTDPRVDTVETRNRIRTVLKDGLMDRWKTAPKEEREGAVYEIAWPMLHNGEFYGDRISQFEFRKWNEKVRSWFTEAEANYLTLEHTNLRMVSLPFPRIVTLAEPHLRVRQEWIPVYSIWETDPYKGFQGASEITSLFRSFCKILIFDKP
jgi:hypothetical protein